MIEVYGVQGEDIISVWPKIEKWVSQVHERAEGRFSHASFLKDLFTGEESLWLIEDDGNLTGFFTIRILQYPHRRLACMKYVGGEGIEKWWLDAIEKVIDYGREFGCDGVENDGRDGFWKFAKQIGFKRRSVYTLDL